MYIYIYIYPHAHVSSCPGLIIVITIKIQGWGSLTMSLTGRFVYMDHHFILLRLNPFDFSLRLIGRDGGLSTLCHSSGFACQERVLKTFPGPGYLQSPLQGWGSLTMSLTGKFVYIRICT